MVIQSENIKKFLLNSKMNEVLEKYATCLKNNRQKKFRSDSSLKHLKIHPQLQDKCGP